MPGGQDELVILGRISGVHGVRGWVKVVSFTDPREAIVAYGDWLLLRQGQRQPVKVVAGGAQGRTVVAGLDSFRDRDQAAEWIGADIAIRRADLPEPGEDEYYWADLIGLEVRSREGERIGFIERLFETGAHDVMVVGGEGDEDVLIPFVPHEVVLCVDLEEKRVTVDWAWD